MTSTDIERRTSELAISPGQTRFTDVQVAALRHLGLQGDDADDESLQFSDADLGVFFHQCARTGLDPFARQIYMIMRKEFGKPKPTIQTGIDGFRKIGRDAGRRLDVSVSKSAPLWLDDSGNEHRVWAAAEPPAAAMVNIIVDGIANIAVCNYREFVQRKRDGKPNSMWVKMPANMLAKCAEAAAWRMAFPSDFSGIVGTEEPTNFIDVDSEGRVINTEPPGRRQQPTGRGVAGLEQHLDASNSGAKPEPAQVIDDALTAAQQEAIVAGLDELFPGEVKGRAEYVCSIVGRTVASLRELKVEEAEELLSRIAEDNAREREEKAKTTTADGNFTQ